MGKGIVLPNQRCDGEEAPSAHGYQLHLDVEGLVEVLLGDVELMNIHLPFVQGVGAGRLPLEADKTSRIYSRRSHYT